MKKVYAVAEKICSVLAFVSYAAFIAAMFLTVTDVVMRKLFNRAIYGSYELTELLMVCLVFAALAYAQTQKAYTRVTMFIRIFPHYPKMIIYSINEFLTFVIGAAATYAAYLQAGYALKKHLTTANLYIPLYPFYIIETICLAVFTIVLLLDAIYTIMGIFRRDIEEDIMSKLN